MGRAPRIVPPEDTPWGARAFSLVDPDGGVQGAAPPLYRRREVVHVVGRRHVNPNPHALVPVSAFREVVLDQEEGTQSSYESGAANLTLVLPRLLHVEPDHVSIPCEARLDVINGQRRR
jgi:hypothetical protein